MAGLCALVSAGCALNGWFDRDRPVPVRPAGTAFADITPRQAKRLLDKGDAIYLDVRTVSEYEAGHPAAAMNIPLLRRDESTGRIGGNDEFLSVVQANIPPDQALIVGCHSGKRSRTACALLLQAGYTQLWNMNAGYGGTTDDAGEILQQGWSTLGYPIMRGSGGEKSYESLRAKRPG